MLVLSRQRDETIMIGDDIEITIVDIRGDKVRLGITAPATIPVHRKEVYDAIQRENRAAAGVKIEDLGGLPRTPGRPSVPPGLHRPAARPTDPKAQPSPNGTANGTGHANAPTPPIPPAPPPGPPQAPHNPGNPAGSIPA
jgi:carbon storage regulator